MVINIIVTEVVRLIFVAVVVDARSSRREQIVCSALSGAANIVIELSI